MSCFHPIIMWDNTHYSRDPETLDVSFVPSYSDPDIMERQGRRLLLPCRHCVGCRLDKSREWANRIIMEQPYHSESWFLTLTYDDDHLPPAYPTDPATGEILSVHSTLVKSDLQKFWKRLRKNSGQKISYFASGEYGSTTYRPHYHALVFGLHLDDPQVIKHGFDGTPYYTSDFISKCWPYGMHILGNVTWKSAAYVARYTMKKATHGYTKEYYKLAGIESEFQTISSKPAIGRRFYDDHPHLFDYRYFNVSTPQGGRIVYPPEYFRKLFKAQHPKEYVKRVHDNFINSSVKNHLKLLLTDKDYSDILLDEERKAFSSITRLIRNTI